MYILVQFRLNFLALAVAEALGNAKTNQTIILIPISGEPRLMKGRTTRNPFGQPRFMRTFVYKDNQKSLQATKIHYKIHGMEARAGLLQLVQKIGSL